MKNFTNNFKQFTSRLSARWLIMALMLLVGTSSAWATIDVYPGETIIIDVSSHSWFNNDNCYPKLYCGNTVIGQASGYESDKIYEITLTITSAVNGTLYVSRYNGNGEYNKQYIDDRSSSKINTFKITGDGNGKWNTTQSSTNIYYLRGLGDFDKWNNIKNPYTIYLNKGDYEFKIYDSNDNWYGNNGTMTRNGTSVQSGGWAMETGKNNCKITADVAGNYTFTFNSTTKKLTVTYPDLPCYTTSDVDPGAISSNATNNVICGSGSVILTLSNTTTKDDLTRIIQWQKYIGNKWSDITNATSTTYTETISATTTYRAKVKWEKSECDDLIEYASESGFTITVNALPSAPALNVPEGEVCAGNLILDDYIADSETNTVNWYTNSGCTEPATNPNLEPSVEETFYAKSKDGNNCISSGYSELTLTSYALPSDFTVTVSENKVCSGEDVTINIEGREYGVDYELENEVIPAEGITVNPTKNTTYSVIASLSECQNMTKTIESQITVNGTTITQSPEVVHPYEVVTFTAGEQAKWALYTNPSSGSQLSDDDAKYSGKDTAYITKGESRTTTFKGEAANGYVIHATVGDCTASYTFNVVEDPDNCR